MTSEPKDLKDVPYITVTCARTRVTGLTGLSFRSFGWQREWAGSCKQSGLMPRRDQSLTLAFDPFGGKRFELAQCVVLTL